MLALLSNPVQSLALEDVQQLITDEVPEGQTIEYKATLPEEEGRKDPWFTTGKKIGKYARDELLAEAVAFANADGGIVVVGMEETDDHPKRAKKIKPLPKCHDLASRLGLAARDCIDPQIPGIEIWGIETHKRPKGGVVVIRVSPSRITLHRLKTKGHCYMRHADRTERMTMREIHDRILQLDQGMRRIEERLDSRRDAYENILSPAGSGAQLYGIRVTTIPTTGNVYLDKPHRFSNLANLLPLLNGRVGRVPIEIFLPGGRTLQQKSLRPIFRGARRDTTTPVGLLIQEIHRDGLAEFVYRYEPQEVPGLVYITNVIGLVANALFLSDTIRQNAGIPSAEFLLDFEILSNRLVSERAVPVLAWFRELRLFTDPPGPLDPIPLRLPTFRVGDRDEFEPTIRDVIDHLLMATGMDPDFTFEIDLP